MARTSALQRFTRQFKEAYGSRVLTTERGRASYETGKSSRTTSAAVPALRAENSVYFEVPTRNIEIAYLVQEMYAVMSPFSRAIHQLSGSAAQDSMADRQPYTIIVNDSNSTRREKIRDILEKTFRITDVGVNGEARIRRMLKTGDAIGEPIFEYDGARWHLTAVKIRPTWEMHHDPKDGVWTQRRGGGFNNKVIAKWEIPDFLARSSFLPDENFLYGIPIGQLVITDYRALIMAFQDLIIAGRTRAPRRIANYIGDTRIPGGVTDEQLQNYKKKAEADPITIVTDYWLKAGVEKVEPIDGDAAGIDALLKIFDSHIVRMKRACGLPADPETLSGRGMESTDADYARNINVLRIADSKFLKSIGDKALLLEGYDDVDWSTQIPPLGETETVRWTRANAAIQWGLIGFEEWCAIVGIKDPEETRGRIKEWMKFRRELGIPLVTGDKEDAGAGAVGTEAPEQGKDPQQGNIRRSEKRRAGQNPPPGA